MTITLTGVLTVFLLLIALVLARDTVQAWLED